MGTAAGLAAASVTAVIVLWYVVVASPSLAFADVAQNIRNTRSVSLTVQLEERHDHFIAKQGVGSRYEFSDGSRVLVNNVKANCTALGDRTLRLWVITRYAGQVDAYEWLRSLGSAKTIPIGKGMVNGKTALGFRGDLPLPGAPGVLAHTTFWIDPTTRLPVEVEQEPLNPAPAAGIAAKVVISDIRFDAPLEEKLFDITAPPGYTVQDNRGPATRPAGPSDPQSTKKCRN